MLDVRYEDVTIKYETVTPHPLINLGGGGQCALVDCPTQLTLICIFWFLYLSVVCHNLQNFAICGPGNVDKFFCVSQF